MKLLKRAIDKDSSGTVSLVPEEAEDMWHIYNLIEADDSIKASTFRKVIVESATKNNESNRVRTTLTIKVESTEYDAQASLLRVKGRNISKNEFVAMNQYHTIDLELNREFSLRKEHWDSVALDRLKLACDAAQRSDLAAVVMHQGLANVCLITSSATISRAKIEQNIPQKKKGPTGQHDKGVQKFFKAVMQSVQRHINFDVVKCVLLGSPGLLKNQFYEYLMQEAVKQDIKVLINNKSKFLLVNSSSGFKDALKEILVDPIVQSRLANTKAAGEVRVLQQFYQMLSNEPTRAVYGIDHIEKANEFQAIEILLISDRLFRCQDPLKRKQYVALVDSVKQNAGDVKIFSSLHISGEQLDQLTGVAAILRYPIDLDSKDEDEGNGKKE